MTDNVITIELDDILGPDGLDGAWDAVIRKLTERVENKFMYSEAGKNFHKTCMEVINSAVRDRLMSKIEERMTAPIQKTDSYGNPMGEATTFDQLIGQAVENALTAQVDASGSLVHGSRLAKRTLLEHAISQVAAKELRHAVTEEVKKVNAEAKAAVAKKVAEAIAAAIK